MTTTLNSGAAALVLALCLTGCGEPPTGADNGVVRGRVTLDGKPLAGVTVAFFQPETKYGLNTRTDADGYYEVRTYREAGLPPGKYQVVVRPKREADSREEMLEAFLKGVDGGKGGTKPAAGNPGENIPPAYQDFSKSGLSAEVTTGDHGPIDFQLTSR
jgi:hypothetical protein